MSARILGRLALLLLALLLVADVIRNLPRPGAPLADGPAGFPWPTRGLGEIEIGMEGRFVLDLEERVADADGTVRRVPSMQVVGHDPRPAEDQMLVSAAEITSFAEGTRQPRLVVTAPRARLPLAVEADGTRRLDREQAWSFVDPVLRFPSLAAGQEFVLETGLAYLDPLTNEVHCPGSFVLRSAGLRFDGHDLRLNPEASRLSFGESDGRVSWELQLADGGVLRGRADGGGALEAISETHYQLSLGAHEECWLEIPEESRLPGRLETEGLRLRLRSEAGAESASTQPEDARWLPQRLDGAGTTFWSGARHALRGATSSVDWDAAGELVGILVDGPILSREWDRLRGWNTASGGAHLDAATRALSLWDRVTAHTAEVGLFADRATVDADRGLLAEGDLIAVGQHGLSFAERLDSDGGENGLQLHRVRGYPSAAEVDRLEAPVMALASGQDLHIPQPFTLHGSLDGQAWEFRGESLESWRTSVGETVAEARGGVAGTLGDANWSGASLQVRTSLMSLRGTPAIITSPLERGGLARARARHALWTDEVLRLQGEPVLSIPAAALGLAGEELTVHARRVERLADGTWLFEHDLLFAGALTGTARRARWSPDGHFRVERGEQDEPLRFTTQDGAQVSLRARVAEGYPEGPIDLEGDLDLRVDPPGEPEEIRLTGRLATLRPDGGMMSGPVDVVQGARRAHARRLIWQGDPRTEPYWVDAIGQASFLTAEAQGHADRMRYDSARQTLDLFEGRRPARLGLQGRREVVAEWIRYHLVDQRVDSRAGVVRPLPEAGDPRVAEGGQ